MRVVICFTLAVVSCTLASVKVHPLSDEFINNINSKQSKWTAGKNFALNTSISDIRSLLGALDNPIKTLQKKIHTITERSIIPDYFDARIQWPLCSSIGDIRDQASCGSCWAVGAVEAMSDRICIHSNGEKQIRVSAEDLLTCCGLTCGVGCAGGFLDSAWLYWVKYGIVSGGEYNTNTGCKAYSFSPCAHYINSAKPACVGSGSTPICTKECDEGSSLNYNDDLTFGETAYYIEMDEAQIRMEIMGNGPVEASFTVYEDFLSYKHGVYQHVSGNELGGHAIKILGWGLQNNVPYWLVANSWNSDWGDNGYFKILRGQNHVGIESNVVTGLPKLN